MRICFFANLSAHADWRVVMHNVEFYRHDIEILKALGHDVVIAGKPGMIDWTADLYFAWWWGHAPFVALPAKLRRKPLIVAGVFDYSTCRGELPGLCFLERPYWQQIVMKYMLRLADANLFTSQSEFEEVTSHLPVRNPILAPCAVDVDDYRPAPHEPFYSDFFFSLSWTSRTNVIRKGVANALRAFAMIAGRHPGLRFVQAGKPGDYHDDLVQLVRDLGIADRVDFVGMISAEDKMRYFRTCIAYVQPTLYEGFGLAIAEAVAAGCPIVSSDRGSVSEVAGPDRVLVDPHDVADIAAAMEAFVGHPRAYEDEMVRHEWIHARYALSVRTAIIRQTIEQVTQ
jgi:glycosyltransferase involved in cell wall biosynthesis